MKSKAAQLLADAIDAGARRPAKADGPSLDIVRRILKAREPAALVELEEGLVAFAEGEAEGEAWLARPLPQQAETVDPLEATIETLGVLTVQIGKLPPNSPRLATLAGAVANLSKSVEKIQQNRPPEVTPDEVQERIAKVKDDAVKKIREHTRAAQQKLEADRAELKAYVAQNVGPAQATEITRRVDEMLSEAP